MTRAETRARAVELALAGDVEGAAQLLGVIEATCLDPSDLAARCTLHANLLRELSLRAIVPNALELRDRALRKAARACANEALEPALRLDALRARADTLRSIPGREPQWRDASTALLSLLEQARGDTRLERAHRWFDLGAMAVPWRYDERARFARSATHETEALVRRALALYLTLGDEVALDIVQAVELLANALVMCAEHVALDALVVELGAKLPRATVPFLRDQGEGWQSVSEPLAKSLRRIADAVESRAAPASVAREEASTLAVGARVDHAKFGRGTVVDAGSGERPIVTVELDDGVTRKLLASALRTPR